VHSPVAKSTLCTADDSLVPSQPPRRSTWPWSLSLSSIATAAEPATVPHDSGGRTNFGGNTCLASRSGATNTRAARCGGASSRSAGSLRRKKTTRNWTKSLRAWRFFCLTQRLMRASSTLITTTDASPSAYPNTPTPKAPLPSPHPLQKETFSPPLLTASTSNVTT
jgi:hypothetical protein